MAKTECRYCGGVTHDDWRGNCAACGAPRMAPEMALYRPGPAHRNLAIEVSVYAYPFTSAVQQLAASLKDMEITVSDAIVPLIEFSRCVRSAGLNG